MKMKDSIIRFVLSTLVMLMPVITYAQCAMCKAQAEQSMDGGRKPIGGINTGIIYMLLAPFILTGVVMFIWWFNRRKIQKDQEA